jgi:Ca2+-binding RTX toxin-like protein
MLLRTRILVGSLAALLATPLLAVLPARAGSSCSFSGATVTVTATGVVPAVLVRSGSDIVFDGTPCAGATVDNTDTIVASVDGPQLDIDLRGGPFAPGLTDEGDGSSEIEFQVIVTAGSVGVEGALNSDHLAAATDTAGGDTLVNLNAEETSGDDADVSVAGAPSFLVLQGRGGDDRMSFTEDPAWSDANLMLEAIAGGGNGTDSIGCALNGSRLKGGRGADTLDCSWPASGIDASLDAETVHDRSGSPTDLVSGFEDVIGSGMHDSIEGNGHANLLRGRGGNDRLLGRGGNDHLFGSAGNDLLNGGAGTDVCRGGAGTDTYRSC